MTPEECEDLAVWIECFPVFTRHAQSGMRRVAARIRATANCEAIVTALNELVDDVPYSDTWNATRANAVALSAEPKEK